jgi:hypothetical protein
MNTGDRDVEVGPRAFRNAGEGELVIVSVCAPPTFSAGRRPPM